VVSSRIIVALDMDTAEDAVRLARRVAPEVGGFKVGLGLLHGVGPGVATALVDLGKPVFADAKLHDIPSQVGAAAARLGRLGVRWVTAHVAGGEAMLAAAVEALGATSSGGAGILAVTVLTSLEESDLAAVGIGLTPGKLVSRMARLADRAGCEGVVCSPRELGVVATVAPKLIRVTPGVRPSGTATADQRRVMTPEAAVGRGADWLVIGRPITAADDPVAAAAAINERCEVPEIGADR
jgi:orotidine-5'-phosphate decarboxylase